MYSVWRPVGIQETVQVRKPDRPAIWHSGCSLQYNFGWLLVWFCLTAITVSIIVVPLQIKSRAVDYRSSFPIGTLIWNRSYIGVFPKWVELSVNSVNSGNLKNHWSMNWAQSEDHVSHTCLTGTVKVCWSLTQEMTGWQVRVLLL